MRFTVYCLSASDNLFFLNPDFVSRWGLLPGDETARSWDLVDVWRSCDSSCCPSPPCHPRRAGLCSSQVEHPCHCCSPLTCLCHRCLWSWPLCPCPPRLWTSMTILGFPATRRNILQAPAQAVGRWENSKPSDNMILKRANLDVLREMWIMVKSIPMICRSDIAKVALPFWVVGPLIGR